MSGFRIPLGLTSLLSSKNSVRRLQSRLKKAKQRSLRMESLERRELMASDSNPLHNALVPADVSGDFIISPIDVLQVINTINRSSRASGEASTFSTLSSSSAKLPMADVNNDGIVSPIDVLIVINNIRSGEGVGEIAEIDIQVLNSSGTALTPTLVGGVPEYTIGLGERFTLRERTRDLRTSPQGVFGSFADITYATQGSPTTEVVLAQWGEYQTVLFGPNTNGGTFTLTYGSETTAPITYVSSISTLRTNIRNAVGALSVVGGVNNVRIEQFTSPSPGGGNDSIFGLSFINDKARVNMPDVSINSSNLTVSSGVVRALTDSIFDPTKRNSFSVALTPVENRDVNNVAFDYSLLAPYPTTLVSSASGFLIDTVGNTSGSTDISFDDPTAFANIVDMAFRASTTPGVVDFTVGPSGDNVLTVFLFDEDTAVPDNLIDFPEPFRIRVASPLQAVNDTFNVVQDSGTTNLPVLSNDTTAVGPFTVTAITQPASGGTVAIANGGSSVSFTPTGGFTGAAQFTYTITAGSNTSTATVTVNVGALNNPPVANALSSVPEDSAAVTLLPSTLFSPGAGEATQIVTLSDVALVAGQTGGTVSLTGGSVVFTPAADFNGDVLFTARGTDNGSPAANTLATFTISVTPVNDAPVANVVSYNTNEDTSLTVNANSMFAAGPSNEGTQTLSVVNATAVSATGGTVQIVSGNVLFTPTANFSGQFLFTAVAEDNGSPVLQSPLTTITINVAAVNDPPVANPDTNGSRFNVDNTPQDNLLDVLANDTAGDIGDTIRVTAVGTGSLGGSIAINNDGSRIIYRPPTGQAGVSETFSYTIEDSGGLTSTTTAEVFIVPTTRPFAVTDFATVAEDGAAITIDVLNNDFANEGATKSLISFSTLSVSNLGTLALDDNGTATTSDDRITFTPAANRSGSATFTYVMNDSAEGSVASTATVTVTVTEVNDSPTVVNQSFSTNEDVVLVMTAGDLLEDASQGPAEPEQVLNITSVNVAASQGMAVVESGNIRFTPAANFNGTAILTFVATDNGTTNGQADPKSATGTITVTVNAVNDLPVAGNDSFTTPEDTALSIAAATQVLNNDRPGPPTATDEVGQILAVTAVSVVTGLGTAALSSDRTNILVTPDDDFNGAITLQYTLSEVTAGGIIIQSSTGTITVSVTPVNDAPVATDTELTGSVLGGSTTPITITEFLAGLSRGAANEASQTITLASVAKITGTNATRGEVSIDAQGQIVYVAPTDFEGEDRFEYTIVDNGTTNGAADPKSSTAVITINVSGVLPSTVDGVVWVDDNNSGNRDRNELFLEGIQFVLTGRARNATADMTPVQTFSDAFGNYSFRDLNPGSYTVTMVRPSFLIDAPEVETASFSVDTRGNQAFSSNFRVLGIHSVANSLWNRSLSTFYTRNGTEWARRGFTSLLSPQGVPLWNAHHGGFENHISSTIFSQNGQFLLQADALYSDGRIERIIAAIPANRAYSTVVEGGNILVRAFVLPQDLAFVTLQVLRPATTPTSAAEGEGFAFMADDIYARDLWK
jgi:hypothetical protein